MRSLFAVLLTLIFTFSAFAYEDGPPNGLAGNPPSGNTCLFCHSTYPLNSGDGSLDLTGFPLDGFIPEAYYTLTLTLDDPDQIRWGFELTSQYDDGSSNPQAGEIVVTQPDYTQSATSSGLTFLKHTLDGTYEGTTGPVTWEFGWTAPDAAVDTVTFYVAGNGADGDVFQFNDYIYTATFDIPQSTTGAEPPVVSGIPDQSIQYTQDFDPINLDDYVADPDTPDENITWTYSGNVELMIDITDRVATITYPVDYHGFENINFAAMDPEGLTDDDFATFTVGPASPVVSDIPDQTIVEGEEFADVMLDDYVDDPDTPDEDITWTTSFSMNVTVTIVDRVASFTYNPGWTGMQPIVFTATDPDGEYGMDGATFTVEINGVLSSRGDAIPTEYSLDQNYPNPFNAETTISFAVPAAGNVSLALYDISGRQVSELYSGSLNQGVYDITVDLNNFASGIYLYSLKTENYTAAKRMLLVK